MSARLPLPGLTEWADLQRRVDDCVADLLAGLTYAQLATKNATFSRPARRPQLDGVPLCTPWPPPVNR